MNARMPKTPLSKAARTLATATLSAVLTVLVPLAATATPLTAPSGGVLTDAVISGGGVLVGTPGHSIQGAVGQTAVGVSQATANEVRHGWPSPLLASSPLEISDPTPASVVTYGTSQSFEVTATGGTENYTFTWEWDPDGFGSGAPSQPIVGTVHPNNGGTVTITSVGDSSTLTLTDLNPDANGYYRATVADDGPEPDAVSNEASLAKADPVDVSVLPATVDVQSLSAPVTFTADATGGFDPLTYQWELSTDGGLNWTPLSDGTESLQRQGIDPDNPGPIDVNVTISGAETDELTIDSPLADVHDGLYRVTAEDAEFGNLSLPEGTDTAQSTLALSNDISVTLGSDIVEYAGTPVEVAPLVLDGNGNYTFDWSLDGGALTGGAAVDPATGVLTLAAPTTDDSGLYALTVSDDSGANAPDTDSLNITVVENLAITADPEEVFVYENDEAVFSVTATGGIPTLSYDWRINGASAGALDQPGFTIAQALLAQDGATVDVVVTDSGSQDLTSDGATLHVAPALVVTGPAPSAVRDYEDYDDPITFSVTVSGGFGTPQFTWFVDSPDLGLTNLEDLGGINDQAGNIVLPPGVIPPETAGSVFVVIEENGIESPSAPVELEIASVLAVVPPGLEDASADLGGDFSWTLEVTGGIGTITYEWYKDDGTKALQPIGVSGPTLTFDPVSMDDAGTYEVQASDEGPTTGGLPTVVTSSATFSVTAGLPATGVVGLGILAVVSALLGVAALRRKRVAH